MQNRRSRSRVNGENLGGMEQLFNCSCGSGGNRDQTAREFKGTTKKHPVVPAVEKVFSQRWVGDAWLGTPQGWGRGNR